jgi:hypothetical protein
LTEMGYAKSVIDDETNAYLATSKPEYLKRLFKISGKKASRPFRQLFFETICN